LKEQVSSLESEQDQLYFYQEEDKPQTYTRTGTFIEIEMDSDEIFATVMSWTLVIGSVVIFIYRLIN
jgi:hypothetical protein